MERLLWNLIPRHNAESFTAAGLSPVRPVYVICVSWPPTSLLSSHEVSGGRALVFFFASAAANARQGFRRDLRFLGQQAGGLRKGSGLRR